MQTATLVAYVQETLWPSLEDPEVSPFPRLSESGQANLWQTSLGPLMAAAPVKERSDKRETIATTEKIMLEGVECRGFGDVRGWWVERVKW